LKDPKDQVLFAKGLRHEEAIVLIGALEANGIEAFLKTENLGGHVPGGVNNYIFVGESDLERANSLRADMAVSHSNLSAAETVSAKRNWPRLVLMQGAWLFSMVVVGAVSYQVGRDHILNPKPGRVQINPFDGRSFYEEDSNRDGRPDIQHFLDKQGRIVETRFDRDEDGVAEMVRFYDNDGLLEREEQDADQDGRIDRWDELNADGMVLRARYDLDRDGNFDSESFHDENGALERTITTRDGKTAEETFYENDLATRSLVDLDRNGVLDTEILYDELGIYREARKLKR
jgi:hypothetical protein